MDDLSRPQFSVIVPTSGRESLRRMLRRLRAEDRGDIEVLVVADGDQPVAAEIVRREAARWSAVRYLETKPTQSWGNAQRMVGIEHARGRFLVFIDDDDLTKRGAFRVIRKVVQSDPDRLICFRMRYCDGRELWEEPRLAPGNVSTQQVVVPNLPGKVGSWLTHDRDASAFDFIRECAELQGAPLWRREVIALIHPPPRSAYLQPAYLRWWIGSHVIGRAKLRRAVKHLRTSARHWFQGTRDPEVEFPPPTGESATHDIRSLLKEVSEPVVFDVGANTGQSITRFRELLPDCIIHSFEPGPVAFQELRANAQHLENVYLVNAGVGSATGRSTLIENDHSNMSSILRPRDTWGTIIAETPIEITTLDHYCTANRIERVDLLKIDTQGYELEVLHGAERMFADAKIRLVYLEVTFSDLYEGLPPFDAIYRYLLDRSLRLVALYDYHHLPNRALSWCDALFTRA